MGVAAIIAMFVGIVGVGLIYTTFHETRRSADEAKRSADAFIDAERGRLIIYAGRGTSGSGGKKVSISLQATNHGGSSVVLEEIAWAGFKDSLKWPGHDFGDRESASRSHKIVVAADRTEDVGDVHVSSAFTHIGGFARYRTRFSAKNYSYFLVKLTHKPPSHGVITLYDYDTEEVQHGTWPEDT
jgi:hypothetical protein